MPAPPDAIAFVREYLTRPTEATTRLVFADWLEETGAPQNAAWAHFIRLREEAMRHDYDSAARRDLFRQADEYARKISAKLTISAKLFVGYPKSLLQLLPAPNIIVRLANFDVPLRVVELVPESVARENLVLPLDMQGRTLFCATTDPLNTDTAQKLEFILNRCIVFVGAEEDDILEAINRHYGLSETETVDSVLVDFAHTVSPFHPPTDFVDASDVSDAPVVRLVNLIFTEAVNLRADRILLYPDLDAVGVRYRIDGEWVERDRMPARLLRPVTTRIGVMAVIDADRVFADPVLAEPVTGVFSIRVRNLHFRFRVTMLPSPDGPTTQIDLIREPVAPH